jgi:hypothetical protein
MTSTDASRLHVGMEAIARRFFGRDDPKTVRRARYLTHEIKGDDRLPTFKIGKLDATTDELADAYIAKRERAVRP